MPTVFYIIKECLMTNTAASYYYETVVMTPLAPPPHVATNCAEKDESSTSYTVYLSFSFFLVNHSECRVAVVAFKPPR